MFEMFSCAGSTAKRREVDLLPGEKTNETSKSAPSFLDVF